MQSKTGICWLQTGSEKRNLTRNHLKRVLSRSWHDDLRRKSLSMYVYTNLARKQGCIVSNREKSGYTAMCIERCGTTDSSNRYASKICKMRRSTASQSTLPHLPLPLPMRAQCITPQLLSGGTQRVCTVISREQSRLCLTLLWEQEGGSVRALRLSLLFFPLLT